MNWKQCLVETAALEAKHQNSEEGIQVPEAALPEAVAPGSDATLANTCEVAEQATISDVSLPRRLAAANQQVGPEENAPKESS